LNNQILLSNMKIMALQSKGVFHLKYIFTTHTYHFWHVNFYHMLTILNFIPYCLPKVLTFLVIYLAHKWKFSSLEKNLYFESFLPSNFIYLFIYFCDGAIKLANCQTKNTKKRIRETFFLLIKLTSFRV
jgi:hypothetical protein